MDGQAQFLTHLGVRFERTLPGAAEQVWEMLTVPERLPAWYGEAVIEPRPGGVVRLMAGHVRGVITQWRPPRRLAYSWNVFGPGEEESPYPESYLSFELRPARAETRLILTHLPVLEAFERQNAMGWHTFLDMMEAGLRGEAAENRVALMRKNADFYGVDLGNLVR